MKVVHQAFGMAGVFRLGRFLQTLSAGMYYQLDESWRLSFEIWPAELPCILDSSR